jgi:GTP pyrophosphokinase
LGVELIVAATDRRGLVRDVTDLVAQERLSIHAMTTTTEPDSGTAELRLALGIRDLEQLGKLMKRLTDVPSVHRVRRSR